jgi:predicted nucleic acid-binding protein
MAPTTGNAVFVDTNILVYSTFRGTPFHEAARSRLSATEWCWTSRQTLREFLASTTRPDVIEPTPAINALEGVRQFEPNSKSPMRMLL